MTHPRWIRHQANHHHYCWTAPRRENPGHCQAPQRPAVVVVAVEEWQEVEMLARPKDQRWGHRRNLRRARYRLERYAMLPYKTVGTLNLLTHR